MMTIEIDGHKLTLTAELAIYVKAGYYAGFTFDWDISDFEGYDYRGGLVH